MPVCVFYYCRTYYKAVRVGGRRVEDMCYERRRAEAYVDESAHHALVNAGGRTYTNVCVPVFPGTSRLGIITANPKLQGDWRKTQPPS